MWISYQIGDGTGTKSCLQVGLCTRNEVIWGGYQILPAGADRVPKIIMTCDVLQVVVTHIVISLDCATSSCVKCVYCT